VAKVLLPPCEYQSALIFKCAPPWEGGEHTFYFDLENLTQDRHWHHVLRVSAWESMPIDKIDKEIDILFRTSIPHSHKTGEFQRVSNIAIWRYSSVVGHNNKEM